MTDSTAQPEALTPDELLTTTRSVRKRLDFDRPVPMELIRECLEIALQAPSGSNKQDWQWIVVTDPATRATIGEYYRKAVEKYLSPAGAGNPAAVRGEPARVATMKRVVSSTQYLAENMGRAPVHLIPCIRSRTLPAANQSGLWGSILPATWSYMLAARARGLGTCWTTLHQTYEQEIAELLGLPEGMRQAALIPTAYFTGSGFKPAPRQPLDEVLHLDRW